jgi:hypothetical protein
MFETTEINKQTTKLKGLEIKKISEQLEDPKIG